MFWKKTASATSAQQADKRVYATGAAKLLQISIARVREAETSEDISTIFVHALESVFVDQSRAQEYVDAYGGKLWEDDREFEDDVRLIVTLFQSFLDQIEASEFVAEPSSPSRTGKVFVVHGHDLHLRDEVCRVIESLSLVPVVLADTAGSSQTIIELIEKHGRVDHAVCLLTADDIGGARDGELRSRARQNVIWEVGYFFGVLGRNRVSIVSDSNVELPSNILGLRPIMRSDQSSLAERLKADLKLAGTLQRG